MANVLAKELGGAQAREISATSVADVKRQLGLTGHSASVNATPQSDDYQLRDGDIVTLSKSVKGGKR